MNLMSMDRGKRMVIALGGNAIVRENQRGTITEQFANTRESLVGVISCIKKGWEIIITHGNGPQVGDMLLRVEASRDTVPELPLGVCVADTEGAMGYMIQQTLVNKLRKEGIKKPVVTIITQVVVSLDDPAFSNPSKPIGPYFTQSEATKFAKERGWDIRKIDHRGYRRVVASPKPLEIIERESIKNLLELGEIIIAAGGGGIPVYVLEDGSLEGVDVVIDKDLASAVLAKDIQADCLMMLTGVEKVYLNFELPDQVGLDHLSVPEAEKYMAEGHFPPGSMGPKIEAAVMFLKAGGKFAIISSIDKVEEAISGTTGTRITMN